MELIRDVELGRAVIALTTQNLELWLTTSITVSPSQSSINIQQLPIGTFLSLLSSGDVWVGRGNGMCMEVELTLRGEPLPHQQFQDIVTSILGAPIFKQLKLGLALPLEPLLDLRPGMARFNITYADHEGQDEAKTRHRLFSNVSAADVLPTEDVPKFGLALVRFTMHILETKQRSQIKRARTTPEGMQVLQRQSEVEPDQNEALDNMLHGTAPASNAVVGASIVIDQQSAAVIARGKRKRLEAQVVARTRSSLMLSPARERINRTHLPVRSIASLGVSIPLPTTDTSEVKRLIDGAMRLSVCCSLQKSSNGLKIKANTFSVGLADVAPMLWKPGYRLTLSGRTHLLPSINRSISQAAGARARSMSLTGKVAKLQVLTTAFHESSPSVAGMLWLHLLKNVSMKPVPQLLPFVSFPTNFAVQFDDNEILGQPTTLGDFFCRTEFHCPDIEPLIENNNENDSSSSLMEGGETLHMAKGYALPELSPDHESLDDDTPLIERRCALIRTNDTYNHQALELISSKATSEMCPVMYTDCRGNMDANHDASAFDQGKVREFHHKQSGQENSLSRTNDPRQLLHDEVLFENCGHGRQDAESSC